MARRYRSIRSQSGRVLLLCLIIGSLTGGMIARVWTHLSVLHTGYEISQATAQHADLLRKHHELRIELAMLKSPARITTLAQRDLNLVAPSPTQVRRLTVPTTPQPTRAQLFATTEKPTPRLASW